MIKKFSLALITAISLAATGSQAFALGNGGFETVPVGGSGDWTTFAGTGSSAHATSDPRSGTGHMQLTLTGSNDFAGVFQVGAVTGLNTGDIVTFSGWHKSLLDPFAGTREVKIEWVGAPQLRVDTFTIGTSYEQFSLSGATPAGVTGATLTYAISSFGPGQGLSVVNIDDFEVTVTPVPEPTTVGLGALGLLGLAVRRRA